MFTLNGKKALVTGASGGLGGAIAKVLAQQGAEVALSGTRLDALEAAAKDMPGKAHVVPCDLGDPAQVDKLIEALLSQYSAASMMPVAAKKKEQARS